MIFCFVELGFDLVILVFKSKGVHFDDIGKRGLRIEEMGFDLRA